MNILAIDSATEACSVAVTTAEGIWSRFRETARGHSELLLAMVEAVIADAGIRRGAIEYVAFGRGPGSFTGVRIAAGVAQGLAYGLGIDVVPVSTLASIAQRANRELDVTRAAVAIDARMGEVYWGAYELADGVMRPVMEEAVVPPEHAQVPPGAGWQGFGTGWGTYPSVLADRLGAGLEGTPRVLLPTALDLLPPAAELIGRGDAVPPAEAQPVYLRDRVTG